PSRNFPTTSPEMQFDQFGFVYATIVPQPSVPAPKIEPQIYGSARIVPVRCGPPCGMMAGGPSTSANDSVCTGASDGAMARVDWFMNEGWCGGLALRFR